MVAASLAAASLLLLAAAPVSAQVAAGYSEYFIPGDEDDTRDRAVYPGREGVRDSLPNTRL